MAKVKEFRDPVHGYISVPAGLCADFVDTAIFQRLKYIQQTSMRPLYPSAHHDRFAHSLGVYHLAMIAFDHLLENTDPTILQGVALENYRWTFVVAALMHDCGHSPFSHTFEPHYKKRAKDFLFSFADDAFKKDYAEWESIRGAPAPHEVFSAAVFLKHYANAAKVAGCNCSLVARMITGCTHIPASTVEMQIENCLIELVNGPAIDVDKLDYIVRDTWSSGVNNVSIDVRRLLAAIEIAERSAGDLRLVFRKSALSVIKSVIDGRNFLYRWIYAHHTVCYYNQALQDAVTKLDQIVSPPDKPGELLNTIFSPEVFEESKTVGPCSVFLPCDSDVFSWLKAHKDRIPQMEELLCRTPRLIPLWKTHAEFELIFATKKTPEGRAYVQRNAAEILKETVGEDRYGEVRVISVKPKIQAIKEDKLFVKLLGKVVSFTDLAKTWQDIGGERQNVSFFYVFVPRECRDRIPACFERIQTVHI